VKGDEDLATILTKEAELAEVEEDTEDDVWVPRKPARRRSMVYSVRIPVERVEELRRVAARAGLDPSAMVRQWVLERLDSEHSDDSVEQHLAGILAAFSEARKLGWGLMLTPDADQLKTYLVEFPVKRGTGGRRTPAKAVSAKAAMKAAGTKKVPARAVAASKKTAKAAPRKQTKAD